MAKLRGLIAEEGNHKDPTSLHRFVCQDNCHICGKKLEDNQEWCWVMTTEEYSIHTGENAGRIVRAQWHMFCDMDDKGDH